MRIVEYRRQGVDIKTLPLSRLRAIDIQTTDEEKEVARIIAERGEPIPQGRVSIEDIKRKMDKDITQRTLTREKELEYQKKIDERMAKAGQPKVEIKVTPEVLMEVNKAAMAEIPEEIIETPLVKKIERLKKK